MVHKSIVLIIALICSCCQCNQGQQVPSLTPKQWIQRLGCNGTAEDPSWFKVLFGDKCKRDGGSWRWNYVSESQRPSKILIQEEIVDERLANIVDTVKMTKTISIFALRFNSGNQQEDKMNQELVAGPQVDDKLCGDHLGQMLDQMDDLARRLELRRANATHSVHLAEHHLYLARALDSFGRYDSGYLSGRTFTIGDYEQCLGSQLMFQDMSRKHFTKRVDLRFCWAQFGLEKHLNPSLRNKQGISNHFFDRNILSSGICIPSSCHSKSFAPNRQLFQELAGRHFHLPKSMYLDNQLELQSVFCMVDEDSPYLNLSLGAILLIFSTVGWTFLTIFATIYTSKQHSKQSSGNILSQLDLIVSWNDLMTSDGTNTHRHVNLDALNGIKVLSYAIIVLGHSLMTAYVYSSDIIRSSYNADADIQTLTSRSYFLIVDTFFVISGLLVGYLGTKKITRLIDSSKKEIQESFWQDLKRLAGVWFSMAISRYLRIVPLLSLVIWFEQSLFIHLGSGPMWDYGLDKDTLIGSCMRTSWLRPLIFFSGTEGFSNCSVPSWFIYCDMYAHMMFVPPLVYLLARRRLKLVYSLVIALIIITSIMATSQFQALDPIINYEIRELRAVETLMRTDFHIIYVEPLYRVARVLIGLLAGHALYCYNEHSETNNQVGKLFSWPKWFRTWTTLLAVTSLVVIILFAAFMKTIKLYLDPLYRIIQLLFIAVVPLIWCSSKAIIFLRLTTDWQNTCLARMGSNQLIITLGKLGFALYLVHYIFFGYTFGTTTTVIHYSKWFYYTLFAMVYLFSNLLATLVHVIIENPVNKLIKQMVPI